MGTISLESQFITVLPSLVIILPPSVSHGRPKTEGATVSRSLPPEFNPLHCAYDPSTHWYRYTSLEVRKKIKACNGSWKPNFSVTAQGKVELKDLWNSPASLANKNDEQS